LTTTCLSVCPAAAAAAVAATAAASRFAVIALLVRASGAAQLQAYMCFIGRSAAGEMTLSRVRDAGCDSMRRDSRAQQVEIVPGH